MAERPSDLTSGDPLSGGSGEPDRPAAQPGGEQWGAPERPAPEAPREPLWGGDAPGSHGPAVGGGYTPGTPVPPGAGGGPPAWQQAHPPAGRHTLAGWWRRVAANIIDALIITALAMVVLIPLGVGLASSDTDAGAAAAIGALIVTILVFSLAALFYAPLMLWKTNGKTVGRMAAGIRVVRASGEPMTFGVAVVREVVLKALVFGVLGSATFGLAYLLDVLWPLWDEQKRALHDFPVNTRTVLD